MRARGAAATTSVALTLFVSFGSMGGRAAGATAIEGPSGVAAAPSAGAQSGAPRELWIPNRRDDDVSVLDAATLQTLARIPLGTSGNPEGIAFSADGSLAFISVSGDDEVVVVDADARTVVNRINVGLQSDPLIFTRPGGDRIFLPDCGETIEIIDVATQTAIDLDPSSPAIDGIDLAPGTAWATAFSLDGSTAYATECRGPAQAPPGIHLIDLTSNTPSGYLALSVPTVTNGIEVSPNGDIAVVTGGDFIVVVDLATSTEVGKIDCQVSCPPGLSATQGVEFNADGSRAYVVDTGSNSLHTVDVTDPTSPVILSTYALGGFPVPWELEITGTDAWVGTFNCCRSFEGEVIRLDISTTVPVEVVRGAVGTLPLEIGLRPQPTAAHGIQNLVEAVGALEGTLPRGLLWSLQAKLENAASLLEQDRDIAAVTLLLAFVNEAEALEGTWLTEAAAQSLIDAATAVVDRILSGG